MLGLKMATDPRWVNIAEMSIADILNDHAYCEQKAASSCISLVSLYAEKEDIVEAVTPVVSEEWGHFRKVLKEMKRRGIKLQRQRKDEYVNKLLTIKSKGGDYTWRMVEELLLCALIEARSCERFRLLSLHCSDPALREFYHEFMVSEAGHYRMFMDLAMNHAPKEKVKARWEEFLAKEAAILQEIGYRNDRMH
jgi:tRNA-(ms[2]io[6]A)-hydroxylase